MAKMSRSRSDQPPVQPFLKWAGGKRQLLPVLRSLADRQHTRYFEPFLGGGAFFFDLRPQSAVLNDLNRELITCYEVVRDEPDALLALISRHRNTSEYYYQLRHLDRTPEFDQLSRVERAARLLWLNKTCYNGLFRVNRRGEFNVPYGRYKNPVIADPAVIDVVSRYLKSADIRFTTTDFADAVAGAAAGDFVYFDPPYAPVSHTASFTGYNLQRFDEAAQQRLRDTCDALTDRGVKLMLSNSDTPAMRRLYADARYTLHSVRARRNINSVSTRRGPVGELIVLNYTP
jgi:DNA adenine methylase